MEGEMREWDSGSQPYRSPVAGGTLFEAISSFILSSEFSVHEYNYKVIFQKKGGGICV